MEFKFCGAAKYVTGSCHLITLDSGYKILLDCGLFQGNSKKVWPKNNNWHFDPAEIDCLVLSHAHIDHTGRLPKLVRDGFRGRIISTHATRSLCAIMLLDSAYIQERDVEYWNKRNLKKKKSARKPEREPLYSSTDVNDAMKMFDTSGYDSWFRINNEVSVIFYDSGHILGSASVTLKVKENGKETLIGFTGDIGRPERPILRDPKQMMEVDYLISESTYGDRDHESKPQQADRFLEIIKNTCLKKKGKVIIPAFSVGRTQEIVYMLDRLETQGLLPKIKVYVDSPLAVNATVVFGAHPECYDNELNEYLLIDDNPFGFKGLNYVKQVADSKALNNSKEPCVIISSSGMMNAGRVKHHLSNNIENPNNTFMMVGYCSPGTPGGVLRSGSEVVRVFGEWKQVKADVIVMDSFSAHGDRTEMSEFISNQKGAKKIFLVHGDPEAQGAFREFLGNKGFDKNRIEIPNEGETFKV